MLGIALSDRVQAVVDSLSDANLGEFRQIEAHLAEFLPALINGGLVTVSTLYGIDGYRYYDQRFPYLILFQHLVEQDSEREYLFLYLMVRADPH